MSSRQQIQPYDLRLSIEGRCSKKRRFDAPRLDFLLLHPRWFRCTYHLGRFACFIYRKKKLEVIESSNYPLLTK